MNAAVVSRNDGFERRARVLPWGIEVQVWRLVETLTLPPTAATLPINSLFPEPSPGVIPASTIEDEKTLENPVVDDAALDGEVEFVYEGGGEGSSK